MKTFYHGSSVGGLKELQPVSKPWSNLKEPLVYMTSSKQLAAHYIWPTEKYEIKSPMLDIRPDGTLVFQEMFSGALEYFYKGLSGWIYQCDGDYEYNSDAGVFTTAASATPVYFVYVSILFQTGKGFSIRRNCINGESNKYPGMSGMA